MADRIIPCRTNTDFLDKDAWNFYKDVDTASSFPYIETTGFFACGEHTLYGGEVALCNRCAQALGLTW